MTELKSNTENSLAACCVWLLVGLSGAVMVATGLLRCFDSHAEFLTALAQIFSGAALAIASWRCGRAALEHGRQGTSRSPDAANDMAMRTLATWPGRADDVRLGPIAAETGRQA
jgi:hypothetical protein